MFLIKKYRIALLVTLVVGAIIGGIVIFSNQPTIALYKFNSGLTLNFDLNKWRLIPNSTNGDIIESQNKDVSIFLTAAELEDKSKALDNIVTDRVSALNKQNISVTTTQIEINDLPFYKIEYTDTGDENIKPEEAGVGFVTLYNGTYTTIQIYYKTNSDITEALDIVSSVKAN